MNEYVELPDEIDKTRKGWTRRDGRGEAGDTREAVFFVNTPGHGGGSMSRVRPYYYGCKVSFK